VTETPQLRELIDRQQIADLLHAYCREVDLCHPAGITALFNADAVGDYGPRLGGVMRGQDELLAFFSGLTMFTGTSHHLSNIMIEFDGPDGASSVSSLFAWHRFPGDAPDAYLHAQYHDRLVRTPSGWRIAERVLRMVGQTGFDALLAGESDGGWNTIGRGTTDSTTAAR
jgi:SnoaL-like domain